MITAVFKYKGQTMTVAEAFRALIALNPTDKYNKQKAAGSLGGAMNSGFLKRYGNTYIRTC